MEVTQEFLKKIYEYDEDSGILVYKVTRGGNLPGTEVGHLDKEGYVSTKIKQKRFYVHRLIWLLKTGSWPENEIDHIDRVRDNNAWYNLRDATRAENQANCSIYGTSPYANKKKKKRS